MKASSPESLWVQKMPGWHFEAAIPLASVMSRSAMWPTTVGSAYAEFVRTCLPPKDFDVHPEKFPAVTADKMTKAANLAILLFDILHLALDYIAGKFGLLDLCVRVCRYLD